MRRQRRRLRKRRKPAKTNARSLFTLEARCRCGYFGCTGALLTSTLFSLFFLELRYFPCCCFCAISATSPRISTGWWLEYVREQQQQQRANALESNAAAAAVSTAPVRSARLFASCESDGQRRLVCSFLTPLRYSCLFCRSQQRQIHGFPR